MQTSHPNVLCGCVTLDRSVRRSNCSNCSNCIAGGTQPDLTSPCLCPQSTVACRRPQRSTARGCLLPQVHCVLCADTGYLQYSSDSAPRPCWRPCDGAASSERPCIAPASPVTIDRTSIIAAELYAQQRTDARPRHTTTVNNQQSPYTREHHAALATANRQHTKRERAAP
jgi:hypothetical protein